MPRELRDIPYFPPLLICSMINSSSISLRLRSSYRDTVTWVPVWFQFQLRQRLQELGQQAVSVAAHVKIRIEFDQTASHFAQSGLPVVILVLRDDPDHRLLDLLFGNGALLLLFAPASMRSVLLLMLLFLHGAVFQQQFQLSEDIARLSEGRRRLFSPMPITVLPLSLSRLASLVKSLSLDTRQNPSSSLV